MLIEYVAWEDVRAKAAMAASVGAGPDIVMGWYDDPHL
jgi:multiple sugar transport system substrate-binding protein